MILAFIFALSYAVVDTAFAAATCDGLTTPAAERVAELERLAHPRPIIWGYPESNYAPYRLILPAEPFTVSAQNTAPQTDAPALESLYLRIETDRWLGNVSYLRVTRRGDDGSRRDIDFKCKVPSFPVKLSVAKSESGYTAEITAIEGSTMQLAFSEKARARLRLIIRYSLTGEIVATTLERSTWSKPEAMLSRVEFTPVR